MKKKFVYIALAVVVGVVAFGVYMYIQSQNEALVPRTEVIEEANHSMLSASRVYGVDESGLPSETTFTVPSFQMDGEDIFVIERDGIVTRYVAATDNGRRVFMAFPEENAEQVTWDGARIIYILNGVLVSATTYVSGIELEAQIAELQRSVGGTLSPIMFENGDIFFPGYCYSPDDLSTCVYRWQVAKMQDIFGFTSLGNFMFLSLDGVSISDTMELPMVYIPVSSEEMNAITACYALASPDGDPNTQCSPLPQ